MIVVWKDATRGEAIIYAYGIPSVIIGGAKASSKMREWEPAGDEVCLQLLHNPDMDGPWPDREEYNKKQLENYT